MQKPTWRRSNTHVIDRINHYLLDALIKAKYNKPETFTIKPRLLTRGFCNKNRDDIKFLLKFYESGLPNQRIVALVCNLHNIGTRHQAAYICLPVWIGG